MVTCEYDQYEATHVIANEDGTEVNACAECAKAADDQGLDTYEID